MPAEVDESTADFVNKDKMNETLRRNEYKTIDASLDSVSVEGAKTDAKPPPNGVQFSMSQVVEAKQDVEENDVNIAASSGKSTR